MRTHLVRLVIALVLAVPLSSVAMASDDNPGIVPNVALPHGSSYGEWIEEWTSWVYSPSWAEWESEGCRARQSGKVFFVSIATPLGEFDVSCTVPPGHMIFVPFQFAVMISPEDCTDAESCTAAAVTWNNRMLDTYVEIDGVPVRNPWQYRALTEPYEAVIAPDSWLATWYAPGPRNPTVADGFFMMLEPPSVGEHTIFIRNQWPWATYEFTYSITVSPVDNGPMKSPIMDE